MSAESDAALAARAMDAGCWREILSEVLPRPPEDSQKRAEALLEAAVDEPVQARLSLLACRAAFSAADADAADAHVTRARKAYAALASKARIDQCHRIQGCVNLLRGRRELAFKILDHRMQLAAEVDDDPLFEGSWIDSDDRRVRAVEEARAVALWARYDDPAWVGALGGLAESHADHDGGVDMLARFNTGLAHLEHKAEHDPATGPRLSLMAITLTQRGWRAAAFLARERSRASR